MTEVMEATKEVVIRTAGGKNAVAAVKGMTVGHALREAGVKPRWGSRLFVDGQSANDLTPVKGGSTITIAPRVRNGRA